MPQQRDARQAGAAALLALALCACEPPDARGAVRAWVFAADDAHVYSLQVAEVGHLESLRELRGRDLEVRRGTGVSEGLADTTIDRGDPFALAYEFDETGAAVPGDLDSLQALSMYRGLDRAATLLRAHGYLPADRLTVYFMPRLDNIVAGDERLLLTDNAAYFAAGAGFLIVPGFVLSDLPMMLNEGVLAHEFGHSVVQQTMLGGADDVRGSGASDPAAWRVAYRHLLAMHEGVADLLGFVQTGDPAFIAATAAVDRDLSVPADLTDRDLLELDSPPDPNDPLASLTSTFDPHWQGSLMARAVYEGWPAPTTGFTQQERGRLLDAVLDALRQLHYDDEFSLASFPGAIVQWLAAADRPRACAVLHRRLALLSERLDACKGL